MSKIFSIILLLSILSFIVTENEDTNDINIETSESIDEGEQFFNTMDDNEEDYENPLESLNYTNILYYDDSNYTSLLNQTEPTYILFYINWDNMCNNFMPIFIETANYCKEKNIAVNFVRIDSNISPNASNEFEVSDYPSVCFIYNDEKYKKEGMVTKEEMLTFLKKKKFGDVFIINQLKEIKDYINKTNLVMMSTLKDKNSELYKSFLEYAESTLKIEFISCISDECLNKFGEDIILFKTFDEKQISYKKDYQSKIPEINNDTIKNFSSVFSIELGAFLGPSQIQSLINYGKEAIIYVRNSSEEKYTRYDNFFKKLGKELRFDNVYVFVSDLGDTMGTNVGDAFSIVPEDLPGIFYYVQNTGDPFANVKIYSKRNVEMKKINIESIKSFIKDVKDGKIKRDLYSEPPSESRVEDGIKYVLGKTFDKDVLEEKKNVFLAVIEDEDYIEEEQKFLRILKKLVKKYENNIVFEYINISRNEPRDLNITRQPFPFGFLYINEGKPEKKIVKFKAKNVTEISENEVINFLETNIKINDNNEDL